MTHPAVVGARGHPAAVGAVVLGAAAISFAPIFVRLSEVGPVATAFWRVALAAPVLALCAVMSPRRAATRWRLSPALVAAAGLCFAGDLAVWHWSIRLTTVANATLLANLSAVVVTLAVWLIYRQRPTITFLCGLALALAGAAMVMGISVTTHRDHLLGDTLGLVTALFYAGYILTTKRLRDAGHATVLVVAWSALVTALALAPVVAVSGEAFLPGSSRGWAVLVGLALISHVGGQTLIAYSLAHLPAAFSSVTLLLQPVLAAALAWSLFGEVLGPFELVGALLVLFGIYLAGRGS